MAGEINIQFPYFEARGGTRVNYGESGNSLMFPAFTATGKVYFHYSGAATVPMQTQTFTMYVGDFFSAALVVPLQEAVGYGGGTGAADVPMQVGAGTMTVPIVARGYAEVPMQVGAGSGTVGIVGNAQLQVPMQTHSGYFGGRSTLTVPMQTVAGHVQVAESSHAALTVPLQQATGTISVFSWPGSGAGTVPMVVPATSGKAAATVPMQTITGALNSTYTNASDYEAWVLNTRNGAVTRWTNFPFTQFAQVADQTYAVGYDGILYVLGGDLDNTAPIPWEIETGIDDLGAPAKKHIPYMYMQGIIDGQIEISIIDDYNRVFAYEYDTKNRGAVHLTHRRKLGNGIRTVNLGVRLKSDTGAYIELDWLGPEITNTQRNI